MLFRLSDAGSEAAAQAAFKGRVRGELARALQKCSFPRPHGRPLPRLTFAFAAYAPVKPNDRGAQRAAADFVRDALSVRPFIFDALTAAFSVIWDEEVRTLFCSC